MGRVEAEGVRARVGLGARGRGEFKRGLVLTRMFSVVAFNRIQQWRDRLSVLRDPTHKENKIICDPGFKFKRFYLKQEGVAGFGLDGRGDPLGIGHRQVVAHHLKP